jgi:hypothetical protein
VNQYAIIERRNWDGRADVRESAGALIVAGGRLYAHVERMTGRGHVLAYASAARKLRDGGRLYVAADTSGGIVIEPLPAKPLTRRA